MEQLLATLETRHTLIEVPFSSRIPLIGGLVAWMRTQWNNVAARWYVLPLVQQQNEINALWLAIFKKQADKHQQELSTLEQDQVEVIQQMAKLDYHMQQLDLRIARLETALRVEDD
jgi:hypothetical protein